MLDTTNSVTNHSRYHTRALHRCVRELSTERKQKLLDEIQLQKAAHNLTGQEYNHANYDCIEKLLNEVSQINH